MIEFTLNIATYISMFILVMLFRITSVSKPYCFLMPIVLVSLFLSIMHFLMIFLGYYAGYLITPAVLFGVYFFIKKYKNNNLIKSSDGYLLNFKKNIILFLLTFVILILVAPATLEYDFYDKLPHIGRFSTTQSILNGHYPPLNIVNPSQPYVYHFGVDLLAAYVSNLTKLSVSNSFKLMTFVSIGYCYFFLSKAFIYSFHLRNSYCLVPFALILSSGLPYFLRAADSYYSLGSVNGSLPPHIVANFFQAPWLLGYPALLACLVVMSEHFKSKDRRASLAVIFVMLVMLTFTQEMVALVISGSFLGVYCIAYLIMIRGPTIYKMVSGGGFGCFFFDIYGCLFTCSIFRNGAGFFK